MKSNIILHRTLFIILFLLTLGLGLFSGYYYTNKYDENKENEKLAEDERKLVCEVRIQKGQGDVRSRLSVFEHYDCDPYINYKNLPADTEHFGLDPDSTIEKREQSLKSQEKLEKQYYENQEQ
jgi:hypothetical protein